MDIGIERIKPGVAASVFLVTQLVVATTAAQPTASNLPPKTLAFPGAGGDGDGAKDRDGDGYTNVEEYINSLVTSGLPKKPNRVIQ